MIHQMSVPCMFIANTAINGSHLAGHSVGTLLSLVYPSRAQHSLPWHPGPSRSKQESRQVFKCMSYSPTFSMFRALKSYVFEIYGPSNMFKNPFGLKIFSFGMTKWLGVSLGVISNTGEFRGILSKVRTSDGFFGRWKFLLKKNVFSCHFPMFDVWTSDFCFKYFPKNKVKCEKTKRSILLFALQKNMYMTCFACFCLLSVAFNISAISVERRAVEADIITYLSKAHEENHQCLAYRNAMLKVKSIWKRHNQQGSLGPIWEGSNVYKCILILNDFEGFPENNSALFGLVILRPLITVTKEETSQSGGQIRRWEELKWSQN